MLMMHGHFLATADARGLRLFALALISLMVLPARAHAQAPQPYLFAQTSNAGQTGTVTFLRDDTAGPLTLLANSASTFPHNCYPVTVDPRGLFLYGMCGDGVSMYALDSTSGTVTEVSTSPFAASRGLTNMTVIAESSGHFVYLLKYDSTGTPATSNFYLDTFQVDPAIPALTPLTSQQLPVAGLNEGYVADPNQRGLSLFLNQNLDSAQYPSAILYTITFDPVSGSPTLDPAGGQAVGQTARCIAISPSGNYLAVGYGATEGDFTVYQIGQHAFTLTSLGNYDLGPESTPYGTYDIPGDLWFDSSGQILYVQAPPSDFTGGGLPFLLFDTSTYLILPSSPVPVANSFFIGQVESPQGPFEYVASPGGGISVYSIDPGSGLPSQPGPIASPFYSQLGNIVPIFAPFGPGGAQGTTGPVLSLSVPSLTFGQTTVGQSSGPQTVTLKNIGNQPVNFASIVLSGANAADFHESDTCLNPPVLTPNQSCVVSVTYSPAVAGTGQASLAISNNAADSPQMIALSGTAVAPPPPAPQVTLAPTSILFPGNTTQGTSSAPIVLTLTNSGNAALHITGTALGGSNVPDFVLSNSTCSGTINPGANCTVSITFAPLATGIRSATWTVTDDAANSPQAVSISGTVLPAVAIGAAASGGNTAASVSAGQSAQFNLQAAPGEGFSGTLTFACTGSPAGAACSPPASVAVSNSSATSFTVTISTSGSAALVPPVPPVSKISPPGLPVISAFFAVLLSLFLLTVIRGRQTSSRQIFLRLAACASLLLIIGLYGCASGSTTTTQTNTSNPPPPAVVTPSGTYSITLSPTATPTGSTRQFNVNPIQLTLTVK